MTRILGAIVNILSPLGPEDERHTICQGQDVSLWVDEVSSLRLEMRKHLWMSPSPTQLQNDESKRHRTGFGGRAPLEIMSKDGRHSGINTPHFFAVDVSELLSKLLTASLL